MTVDDGDATPTGGFAPPTDAGEPDRPQRGSSWPTVIGTIAIVFGSLAAVGSLCHALTPLVTQKIASLVPEETAKAIQAGQMQLLWTILGSLVAIGLGALLLVAGIGLVKHRRWGVKTTTVWAVLKIIYALAVTGMMPAAQKQALEAMQQDPNFPNLPAGFAGVIMAVAMIVSVLWLSALPVFMLIWFSRGKIKHEVGQWT